jgi:ankyrin repeat protein
MPSFFCLSPTATEHNADVNLATENGCTAFSAAAEFGHVKAVCLLGKGFHVDINRVLQSGSTALMVAAKHGRLKIVRCLVNDLGADVNQATPAGPTALTGSRTIVWKLYDAWEWNLMPTSTM